MRKRGDACGCIHRFLSRYPELDGEMQYEDEICRIEYSDGIIKAYAYEVAYGTKYKVGECIMKVW